MGTPRALGFFMHSFEFECDGIARAPVGVRSQPIFLLDLTCPFFLSIHSPPLKKKKIWKEVVSKRLVVEPGF